MTELNPRELARKQIEFARAYTMTLLADIDEHDWFQVPSGGATHLAWQVGHLAMAEYGLCLFRQRGRAEIDPTLMTGAFRKQYGRGSQPNPDPAGNPSVGEILAIFHRVHEQVLREIDGFSPESLAEPVELPYAATATKLGALLFCSHHEMLHAGQIGLLRRMLGKTPIR